METMEGWKEGNQVKDKAMRRRREKGKEGRNERR